MSRIANAPGLADGLNGLSKFNQRARNDMNTTDAQSRLRQSAFVMRLIGWALSLGLVALLFVYPPGFMWGAHSESFPHLGPAHPASPLAGLHPYLLMLAVLYIAYGILMIRGARDPRANAALFDYGIIPQALFYPNEHAHLWADVPACFAVCAILWIWHPNRIAAGGRG
jgi:hypothetical protein